MMGYGEWEFIYFEWSKWLWLPQSVVTRECGCGDVKRGELLELHLEST